MHRFHHLLAVLAGSTALIGGAAQAQAPGSTSSNDADNADILVIGRPDLGLNRPSETGSRLGLSPLETPATISAISGDAIRARGDISVVDAVTRAPGVTSDANPGNGSTSLALRGFSGQGSVLQLVDGIRLFPVAGTITFPTDPWNLERIEVLSGPSSVLYGQGALGGAVNMVTRKPDFARQTTDLEGSFGSQDTLHLAAGTGGPVSDKLAYRVDASFRDSDGWVDRGDNRSIALSAALAFRPTERLTFTLRNDFGRITPMEYFGTPLIDGRIDSRNERRNYNVRDARMRFRDNRLTLVSEWAPSDTLSFTNAAYWLDTNRFFRNLESYCWIGATGDCPAGFGGGTPGQIYRADNLGIVHDQTQIGDQGNAKLSTPLGGSARNDLVVGFDVNHIKLTYSNNFASAYQEDEVNPFVFDPGVLLDTQGIAPRYLTRTTEWSLYAEDRLKLNDQLSLVAGARYEEDKVKRRNILYNAGGIRTGTVNAFPGGRRSRTLDNFTWRVGAVFQPTPTVSIYGQYSTGVDPVGTLTTYSTNAAQFFFTNAKGDQVEGGVKASFLDGRGSATLSAYKIVKKDLVAQRTPTAPVEQIGQRSSKGIEASIALALAGGFSIDANGTVLDADYDDFVTGNTVFTGNTPPGVAERTGNLWLTWQGLQGLRVQAGARYVGRRFSDNANLFRIPAYVTVDGGVSYAITPRLAVDVRLYNILNKDYATTFYNNQQYLLGRPRSVDVALRTRF